MSVAPTDVLVVSVSGTSGWRTAADALADALRRAGAGVASVHAGPVPSVRTFALTDFTQARAARTAAARAIAEHRPIAVVYCSITAALLWPRPGAVWLDCIAAENRPGRHGIWQRPVERRRLAQAPLILTMSPRPSGSLRGVCGEPIVVRVPVKRSGPPPAVRDVAALTYGADPRKRRLDRVLEAWAQARRAGETLVVAGTDQRVEAPGVEVAGRLDPHEYRALLRRARVFLAAPRREDYGIAALEALADGCMLVTTPAEGPYPALELARALDPRLVQDDLASALRIALDDPVAQYLQRATQLLEPFTPEAVETAVAREVIPRLLPTFSVR